MDKVIRDGEVGVLVSGGYGAGWSTWNNEHEEELLFDPIVIEMLENEDNADRLDDIVEYCEKKYPHGYFGGVQDLTIVWIPEGSEFRIEEYDGSEGLYLKDEYVWITA